MSNTNNYLTEDIIKPSMQNFVCISFLTKTDTVQQDIDTSKQDVNILNQDIDSNIRENELSKDNIKENYDYIKKSKNENKLVGIKIRGVFDKYDEACEYAKKLQSIDPHFNIYVGEMGKWLPFDADSSNVQNSEYQNNELNDMMKSYHENQEKANLFHERRKNEMMLSNIKDNIKTRKNNLDELQQELSTSKDNSTSAINAKITCIEEHIVELNNNEKDIETKINELNNKINELNNNIK